MSFLNKLNYDDSVKQDKDTLGGYRVLDSDVYDAVIKHAYLTQAKSGAGAVNFEFEVDNTTYRETMYVTNKHGNNYYEKDGIKNYLPAFINADAISLFTTGKSLFELKDETKVIKLYNHEFKKEVDTEVPMLTELLNKTVKLGIIKELVFKQTKQDDGSYVDTDETREQNSINKVFSPKDNRTVNEVRAEQEEATFYNDWLDKYKDQLVDKTKGKKPQSSKPVKKSGLFA